MVAYHSSAVCLELPSCGSTLHGVMNMWASVFTALEPANLLDRVKLVLHKGKEDSSLR